MEDDLLRKAREGKLNTVKAMLSESSLISPELINTALLDAALYGHANVVEAICDHGADVNVVDLSKQTPLICGVGYIDVVRALLAHDNINVNAADIYGTTALMSAASDGNIDVVRALLAHDNINVNAANNYGNTALMFATDSGHANIVAALLQYNDINVDAVDNNGDTALMCAAHARQAYIVHQLMSRTNTVETTLKLLVQSLNTFPNVFKYNICC